MRALGVVMHQPTIKVGLESVHRLVEGSAKGQAKELVRHRADEVPGKAAGPREAMRVCRCAMPLSARETS